MKMDLDDFVETFNKNKYPGYYVKEAKRYGPDIAYIDIVTSVFNIALDIDLNGNVFLIFRDKESMTFFNDYLKRNFETQTMIYEMETNNYTFGNRLVEYKNIYSVINDVINEIILFHNSISDEVCATKQAKSNERIESLLLQNLKNKVLDDMYHVFKGKRLSVLETLKWLKNNNCGVSRFGDGELMVMLEESIYFQKAEKKLMYELREISSGKHNTLVCYPDHFAEQYFWGQFWSQYWFRCKFFIDQPVYGSLCISRPEGFYEFGSELSDAWMDLWNGKNVCIVTGSNSRLDPEHYLFSNIKTKDIIFTKNKDAYDEIDLITSQCMKKKNIDLFLIALGPAGTVLSARLSDKNKIALDIGHLTNSYDTAFNGKPAPESLPIGF